MITTSTYSRPPSSPTLLEILAAPLRGVVGFIQAISDANERRNRYERLASMSDRQLAELGLERGDLVRHAFRDLIDD